MEVNGQKTALVTGSSRGIGRAIALRLSDDGYRVVINYRKSDQEAREVADILDKKGRQYLVIQADISKEKDVNRLTRTVISKYKSLDVLVNNAGINQNVTFGKMDVRQLNAILDTNLRGTISLTKSALPYLKKSRDPRVIFISSLNSFTGSHNRSAYIVAKSGILGLTKALALELSPKILVNAVVPGYIKTNMLKSFLSESPAQKLEKIPLGRFGEPEEIASVVSFLCSKDSTYVTGQCIHVNGGYYLG